MASHTIIQVLTRNYKNRTVPVGLTTPRRYKLLTFPSGRRFLVTYAVLSNSTTILFPTSGPFTMASGGVSPVVTTPNELSGTSTPADQKVKICVFMGASPGTSPVYMEAARELARTMAEHDIYMVYGGGTVGLMGEVARTLVSLKGPKSVHGIIPEPLVKYERSSESEDAALNNGVEGVPKYASYGRTTVVKDMHTRKQKMVAEVLAGPPGSGFIALPGGFGTMEELMEIVTWNQLGIHKRGIVALNIAGFWDGILEWVQGSVEAGFIAESNGSILKGTNSPEEAVQALKDYQPSTGRFQLEWGNVSQG